MKTAALSKIRSQSRLSPVASGLVIATAACMVVGYLLWPTWRDAPAGEPDRLPVSVGGTLFNVPARAFRVKVQKHSGPQERVDLAFTFPSLNPPEGQRHVSAETIEQDAQPPSDRLFVSIVAHGNALPPEVRAQTIYPRYLEAPVAPPRDGMMSRAFREGSPYGGEDLFFAQAPSLVARCSRDGVTPGMCLSERRDGNADITFRFPRQWLAQWKDVANAMDRVTAKLQGPKS